MSTAGATGYLRARMTMALKKIEYTDYTKTVTIRSENEILLTNLRIGKFLELLTTFEGVVKTGMKKMEIINGPPVYDYYMQAGDDREFTETVTVDALKPENVQFTFDVPDPWSQEEVEAYFNIRKITTDMFLDHLITDIVVKWK